MPLVRYLAMTVRVEVRQKEIRRKTMMAERLKVKRTTMIQTSMKMRKSVDRMSMMF
jgi:hypothetical protein